MKSVISAIASVVLVAVGSLAYAVNRTVTLDIPGMNCPACPITVKKALQRVEGVENVSVSYERREAVVTFDDAKANVETLINATTNVGYPSTVKAN